MNSILLKVKDDIEKVPEKDIDKFCNTIYPVRLSFDSSNRLLLTIQKYIKIKANKEKLSYILASVEKIAEGIGKDLHKLIRNINKLIMSESENIPSETNQKNAISES